MLHHWIRPRSPLLPIVSLMLLTLAASAPALGTTLHFLKAETLFAGAGDVVHGEVLGTEVSWNAEQTAIFTKVTLKSSEWFKGAGGEEVEFTVLGGEVDGKLMTYHHRPLFSPGEQVLVFLTRDKHGARTLMALSQGKWRVLPQRAPGDEAVFARTTRGVEFEKKPGNRIEPFDPAAARSVWRARELRQLSAGMQR